VPRARARAAAAATTAAAAAAAAAAASVVSVAVDSQRSLHLVGTQLKSHRPLAHHLCVCCRRQLPSCSPLDELEELALRLPCAVGRRDVGDGVGDEGGVLGGRDAIDVQVGKLEPASLELGLLHPVLAACIAGPVALHLVGKLLGVNVGLASLRLEE